MIPNLAMMTAAAVEFTAEVTKRWPARLTGSDACLACADHLVQTMRDFCDQTETQQFSIRPGSFLGFVRINVVLYLLTLIALWLDQRLFATAVSSLAVVITVLQFFLYYEFVDFFFPRKYGKNVWGTIEPTGETRQQIFVTAHHDSAHVFNFLERNAQWYVPKVVAGTAILFLIALIAWILLIGRLAGYSLDLLATIAGWGFVACTPLVLLQWFFYSSEGTPGAGDNMICTAVALQIGKYFADQRSAGDGLKHTRLIVGSWDSEEAGLRGARAFVRDHQRLLREVKTYNFNLECLYDHQQMTLLTSDLNSFVPLSRSMARDCSQIAEDLGYVVRPVKFPFLAGGTDAAEFAKSGVEATTLAAMNWVDKGESPAYHTTRDTIDAVDPIAVQRSIDLGIHYVLKKDQEIIS